MAKDPKPLSPAARIVLQGFIMLCFLFTSGVAALHFKPGLAILPFTVNAKISPYCSAWKGVQDADVKLKQAELEGKLEGQCRLVRQDGHYKLWSTPHGEFWVPETSDHIIATLLAQQERKIYGDASSGGVRKGDIVLDGGAHIGTYVRTALDAGADKVVAIDPSPEALECLRRNFVKEIASGKVIVYPKGIWDEEKRLVFYANGNGAAGDSFVSQAANAKPIADIPVTTIDRIVKELNLPRVDIIKADIKGAGTRMIFGAVETLTKHHPRLVISVEEEPEDPAAIHAAVMKVAPSYRFRPGPCLFSVGEIRNDTVFFE